MLILPKGKNYQLQSLSTQYSQTRIGESVI